MLHYYTSCSSETQEICESTKGGEDLLRAVLWIHEIQGTLVTFSVYEYQNELHLARNRFSTMSRKKSRNQA